MINKQKLSSLVFSFGIITLMSSFSYANPTNSNDNNSSYLYDDKSNKDSWPTSKMNIFEGEDEKRVYTDHGFTRGDVNYLHNKKYDSSQVKTVTGKVDEVVRVQFPDKDTYLVAVMTTPSNEQAIIDLGPIWYVEENGLEVNEGDTVKVTGSKMRTNGRFVLIASEISKNGQSLKIRDNQGSGLWGTPKSQKGNAKSMDNMHQ